MTETIKENFTTTYKGCEFIGYEKLTCVYDGGDYYTPPSYEILEKEVVVTESYYPAEMEVEEGRKLEEEFISNFYKPSYVRDYEVQDQI
jgi:hypothetical protein